MSAADFHHRRLRALSTQWRTTGSGQWISTFQRRLSGDEFEESEFCSVVEADLQIAFPSHRKCLLTLVAAGGEVNGWHG